MGDRQQKFYMLLSFRNNNLYPLALHPDLLLKGIVQGQIANKYMYTFICISTIFFKVEVQISLSFIPPKFRDLVTD